MIVAIAIWLAVGLFCLTIGAALGGAAGIFRTGVIVGLGMWGFVTMFALIAIGISFLYKVTEGAS
jgi:hypothetical protein